MTSLVIVVISVISRVIYMISRVIYVISRMISVISPLLYEISRSDGPLETTKTLKFVPANWASEASPTLGCSIEISGDIYIYSLLASERSERDTLRSVQLRIADIFIYIYIYSTCKFCSYNP